MIVIPADEGARSLETDEVRVMIGNIVSRPIHQQVTASYPSQLEVSHASQVKLTAVRCQQSVTVSLEIIWDFTYVAP
jgi:hypothetical protein